MLNGLTALIIDSSSSVRSGLKDAAHHSASYRHVFVVANLGQGISQLANPLPIDVFFISAKYGHDAISRFIREAKNTKAGHSAAFISIVGSSQEDSLSIARDLTEGFDGFILAPFSVESVSKSVEIAAAVKRRQTAERLAAASSIVINSAMSAIDERAKNLTNGKDKPFKKNVKEVVGQFKEIAGEAAVAFISNAIDMFSQIEHPPSEPEKVTQEPTVTSEHSAYSGPSELIKRKYAKKQKEQSEHIESTPSADKTSIK